MLDLAQLEAHLYAHLPVNLHGQVPELARLLQQANQTHQGNAQVAAGALLAPLLEHLRGEQVQAGSAVISFGSDNHFNDITIGDVAGGNLVKLHVTFQDNPHTTRRLRLIIAGLVMIAVLAGLVLAQNNATRTRRLAQSQQALIADVFANITNLDAQLLFVDTSLNQSLDANTASNLAELIGLQQVAALQSGLNRNPLSSVLNPTLSEAVVESGANAERVQQFYQTLRVVEDNSASLLNTLSQLARTGTQNDELRDQYKREADLNHRMFALNGQIAYLQALQILDDLQTEPNVTNQQLALLQRLQPASIASREEIERKLVAQELALESLLTERAGLLAQSQQELDQSLVITSSDSWQDVVGKAIALRKRGQFAASITAFKRYGEMFSASDTTAAQYAVTGQQFTQHLSELGVEGGVYIWDVQANNPAQQAGFQVGDIITMFNNQPVETIDGFEAAQSSAGPDAAVPVTILRLQPDGSFTRQTITVKGRLADVSIMPI